ncbi:hypothetical protein G4B88_008140 [Cannabis sativa]|uniref:RNase H type-1 domain-containing protein n=1 Tax=Cannabis sativa TaxID=3483 RepID=A0A7J6I7B5_CANSA|nr:hypothetical protein G4B88_008140 [Cannabis sativa]
MLHQQPRREEVVRGFCGNSGRKYLQFNSPNVVKENMEYHVGVDHSGNGINANDTDIDDPNDDVMLLDSKKRHTRDGVQSGKRVVGQHSIGPCYDPDNPCVVSNHSALTNCKVSQLMKPSSRQWDLELIEDLFDSRDDELIKHVPLSVNLTRDSWLWNKDPTGFFTVKNALNVNVNMVNSSEPPRKIDKPPPPDIPALLNDPNGICVCVDSALDSKGSRTGIGAVLLKHPTQIIARYSLSISGNPPPLFAEAQALFAGIRWTIESHFRPIFIASDYEHLVLKVNSKWKDNSTLSSLV